jgi:hypothetical protein
MKNLIALLSLLLVIGGCATTPTYMTIENPLQRADYCKTRNVGNYYGDCWVNRSKSDPSFFKVIDMLEMRSDFNNAVTTNQNLLEGLKIGKYSTKEANASFDEVINLFNNQKTFMFNLRAERDAERTAAFRRAMRNLSSQMKENRDAFDEGVEKRKPISTGQNRPLRSQTVLSDNRRSCIYGTGSNQKMFVTAVGERCPSSM